MFWRCVSSFERRKKLLKRNNARIEYRYEQVMPHVPQLVGFDALFLVINLQKS